MMMRPRIVAGLLLALAALAVPVYSHTTDICFGLNTNQKVEVQVFHWHGCRSATGYVDVTKTSGGAQESKRLHFALHQCTNRRAHYQSNGYACADTNNNGDYDDSFHGTVDFYCNSGDTFAVHAYSNPSYILVHSGNPTFNCPAGGIKEPNVAPTDISIDSSSVNENSAANQLVGTLTTADSNNYDKNNHVYTIISGSQFKISGAALVVKTSNTLNYEATSSYSVKIRSADLAGSTVDKTFTITIKDVNEAPTAVRVKMPDGTYPTSGGLPSPQIPENAPLSGAGSNLCTLEATDPDSGQSHTFSLQINAGKFTLSGSTLKLSSSLNYEADSELTIQARASDNGSPALSADFNIKVRITNVNEPPTDISITGLSVDENKPVGTVVGTLTTTDPDVGDTFKYTLDTGGSYFNIDGNKLVTKVGIDFESTPTIAIRIKTTDQNGAGYGYSKAFTVTIGDVDEPPVATNLNARVDEEMPIGTLVGQVTATQPGKPNLKLTFTIDPNNPPAGDRFVVQACSGNIYTNKVINYEVDPKSYAFKVKIQGDVDITADVLINIDNINEVPQPANQNINLDENKPAGTVVTASVPANDPDAGQNHVYAINQGDDGNAFAIDSATGKITVNNPVPLNFEARGGVPFDLLVSVNDGGLVGYANIKITIQNVDEPPNFESATRYIPENTAANTVIAPELTAFDEDGSDVTFAIVSGNVNNAFKLGATRGSPKNKVDLIVNVAAEMDHEDPTTKGVFSLGVQVSDPAGNKLTKTVTVFVTDVNEAPTISGVPTFSVAENTAKGTVVGALSDYASDVDAGTTLSYQAIAWDDEPTKNPLNAKGGLEVGPDGKLTIGEPPNYELSTKYIITVRITDNGGLKVDTVINIAITNVNEPPNLDAGHVVYIPENSPQGTKTTSSASGGSGTLCATDPELSDTLTFSIVSGFPDNTHFQLSGKTADPGGSLFCITIEAKTGADYELNPKYTLRLKISDGSLDFEENVDVMITDANDAPTLPNAAFAVGENSKAGKEVGAPIVASDQDVGDDMTFAITGGNTENAFEIEKLSNIVGRLKVASGVPSTLQALTANSWSLTVKVTDKAGASDTATLSITLAPENDPPDMTGTPTAVSLPENNAVGRLVFTAKAVDPEGDSVKFSIGSGNSASAFAIGEQDGRVTVAKSTALNFESDINSFVLTIEARDIPADNSNSLTSSVTVTVSLTNVNEAPTLPAPIAMQVDENSAADKLVSPLGNIEGRDVDAGDEDKLKYAITSGNVGSVFKLDADTGVLRTTGASIDYETTDSYTLGLRVTDPGGLTASSSLTVSVRDLNEAPTLTDQARSVEENLPKDTFVGAVVPVSDPDAGQTFTFSIAGGLDANGDPFFGIQNNGQIFLLQPLDYESKTSHTVTVTAHDQGGLASNGATVTIAVKDVNEAPVFDEAVAAGGDGNLNTRTIKENSAKDTKVGGPIAADPIDANQKITFSLPSGENDFRIDASSGQVYLKNGVLNFELKSRYPLVVTATDNGSPAKATQATLIIDVTDVNEKPWATWNTLGTVFQIEENFNGGIAGTFTGADVDDPSTNVLSFSFAKPNAQFDLASNGVLKTKVELNYEAKKSYAFDVTVCDSGVPKEDDGSAKPLCDTQGVTVHVIDVNEAPVIWDQVRPVEENSPVQTKVNTSIPASDVDIGQVLMYSITNGNEEGIFSINPCSGQIEVRKAVLNFEVRASYVLTVEVVDNGVPALSANATVTVQIIDVNEAPTIEPTSLRVDENSAVNSNVGGQISGADQDAGDKLSWKITDGNVGGAFKIVAAQADGKKAQVQVAADILNFERLNEYLLTIVASDDADPPLTATATVAVTIADVNEAPTVVLNGDRSVPENSPAGTSLGEVIRATDPDADDSVKFSITGGDGSGLFVIDGDTGAMATKTAGTLDFETKSTYSVEITATDARTPTQTGKATLTVRLIDVNEKPSLAGTPATVRVFENSPAGTGVGPRINGTDVDAGQGLIYSITSGNGAGLFRIDTIKEGGNKGQGQLLVAKSDTLNYEAVTSYDITVTVTDSGLGALTATANIKIMIDNVNEPPRVDAHTVSVLENSAANVLVGTPVPSSDDDVGDTRSYSITTPNTEAGFDAFAIDATTGQISVSAQGTPSLDYEAHPTLNIHVTVTDAGGLSATRVIVCTLHNVNEAPTMAALKLSVPQRPDLTKPLAIGVITAADVDATQGQGLVYSMTAQSDSGIFTVGADGIVYAVSNPGDNVLVVARDASNPFTVTVQVSDSGFCCANADATDPKCCDSPPTLTATAIVTITVADQNRAPVLSDPAAPLVVSENVAVGTVVGDIGFSDVDVADQTMVFSVRKPDDATFGITQANVMSGGTVVDIVPTIVTKGPINYEKKDVYSFLVDVVDQHPTDPLGATLRVLVYVRDVNEAPSIVLDTLTTAAGKPALSVNEDAAGVDVVKAGYAVGRLRFEDPDAQGAHNASYGNSDFATLSWSIKSDAAPLGIQAVADDPFSALVYVTDSGIDFEKTPTLPVEVTVRDAPGLSQTTAGTIKVNNMNDQPANTDRTFSVHETAAVGTPVGSVPGTDEDKLTLTYRIVAGEDRAHFAIDSLTAEIRVASTAIDFERKAQYVLTVSMTDSFVGEDPKQWTVNSTVTINVINDNDITITGFGGPGVPHSTVGFETVEIYGTDFGPMATRDSTVVSVRYGAVDGTEFEAKNCKVTGDQPATNKRITCTAGTAPGSGGALRWTVTVGGFTRTSGRDVTTSYKAPTITALSASVTDMATAGNQSVTITGHDFGPETAGYDKQLVVSYAAGGRRYIATGCRFTTVGTPTLLAPTQMVTCKTVAGVGTNITWTVEARLLKSPAFARPGAVPSRYALPAVARVQTDKPLLSTRGANVIVITGTSFGVAGMEAAHGLVVQYGPYFATGCRVSNANPHTQITCNTAPGIGADHEVRVTVGGQLSPAAGASGAGAATAAGVSISYLVPVIDVEGGVTGDGAQNAGTKGNQNVVIKGDMFGTAEEVARRGDLLVTYGRTGGELVALRCYVAVDHVQINCETNQGTGKDHAWKVRIGSQWSPLNRANTSYANPIISYYEGPGSDKALTQGDQSVYIHGENFGPDWLGNQIVMTYQAQGGPVATAQDCYIKTNHTLIACKTAPGAGKEHKWQALIDGLVSTTPTTNYAPPTITAIDGPGAVDASTYGGEQVNIHGTNFGAASMQSLFFEGVTYGPSGFGYTATNCEVKSHVLITCRTAPGVGAGLRWIVSIEGQQSRPEDSPTTSYAAPFFNTTDTVSGPTNGGFEVTVTGANLGFGDSSSEVVLEINGIGGARKIVYPSETTPGGAILPGGASARRLLVSSRSGVAHRQLAGLVGPTQKVAQAPDTLKFKFPAGRGMGKTMVLVVRPTGSTDASKERKSSPVTFNFDPPTVARVVTREDFGRGQSTPDMEVTIHGASFGADPAASADSHVHLYAHLFDPAGVSITGVLEVTAPRTNPNDGQFYDLLSWTHDKIVFMVFNRGAVQLVLNSTGVDGAPYTHSTPLESYNFFSPSISALTGANGEAPPELPTDGSYMLRIEGRNLWTEGVNVSVTIGGVNGGVPCTEIAYDYIPNATGSEANQVVTARLPPWTGHKVPVVVFKVFGNGVPEQGSAPFYVDFATPAIRPLPGGTKFEAHTDGSTFIQVEGTALGVMGAQLVFGSDYAAPLYLDEHNWDHTQCSQGQLFLRCKVPPGEGDADPRVRKLYTLRARVPRLTCTIKAGAAFDSCVPQVDTRGENYLLSPDDTVFFTYKRPSIASATQQLTTAGQQITIWGRDFGVGLANRISAPNTPVVTLEKTGRTPLACTPTAAWLGTDVTKAAAARETITCTLESGTGSGWTVKVVLAGLMSAVSTTVTFAPPAVDALPFMSANGTTNGGYTVALTGTNFGGNRYIGLVSLEIRDRYDAAAAVQRPALTKLTHALAEFAMPEGHGFKTFTLVVDGQASNAIDFAYNAPSIEDVTPRAINTNGGRGQEMTIVGTSLGASLGIVEIYSPPLAASYKVTNSETGEVEVREDSRPARWYNCTAGPAVCVEDGTPAGTPIAGCECKLDKQSHGEYKLWPPGGMGQQLTLRVFVGSGRYAMVSETVSFGYALPTIDHVIPTPADSEGDDVKIYGENFGGTASLVVVGLDGVECKDAAWVKDKSNKGAPYLRCRSARHKVGGKNVSLSVAFQDTALSADESYMITECKKDFYGQENELCVACPQGGKCAGKAAEPVSIEGWYNLNMSVAEGKCHKERGHRAYCNYLVPCEPPWACVGENKCAVGYVSKPPTFRCADCDLGYYRLAGECVECPDNPLFLIIGFAVAAILACIAGYFLNSKSVNLAFVSIGVDYFQVLAMFRNSRVQWPPILKQLFHLMSIFNFNLEITAPECSIPDLGYVTKWFFIEGLPVAAAFMLFWIYVVQYCNKRICKGRKKKLHAHAPAMIGTSLVLFYYLYLYLTRTVLDVFNCAPTQPPDGKEYLEVVFEECGLAGGIQMTLLPWALIAMLVYVLGYPSLVGTLLVRNKLLIMEDQLLRAKDQGGTRLENRNAYDVRKKYSKLYYHFKPTFWYWILCVIGRKFGIAFTSLMFNKNPAFQLSMALLVLFVAYALQVKNAPFMSMSERAAVIADHKRRVQEGDALHIRLAANLGAITEKRKKKGRRFSWGGSGMVVTVDMLAVQHYFFDYNTVEATLLFCAVLVCLAGVMFESNRFDTAYFETQKLIIVICVLIVIFFSILYFMTVMLSEIYTTICKKVPTKMDKGARATMRKQTGKSLTMAGGGGGGIAMKDMGSENRIGSGGAGEAGLNPLFASGAGAGGGERLTDEERAKRAMMGGVPDARTWEVIKSQFMRVQTANEDMVAELVKVKKAQQTGQSTTVRAVAGYKRGVRAGAGKKEFAAQKAGGSARRVPRSEHDF